MTLELLPGEPDTTASPYHQMQAALLADPAYRQQCVDNIATFLRDGAGDALFAEQNAKRLLDFFFDLHS